MTRVSPPLWAERVLRLLLAPADREPVIGDLLEHYRAIVRPARGQPAADRWYILQVCWFAWRATRVWAALAGAAFVIRTAFDWLVPPTDFHVRSTVSTLVVASVLVLAAASASWRSRAPASGALVGVMTTVIAGVFSIAGVGVLLAAWHDEQTLAAIAASGGLSEAFALPLMLIVPGVILGVAGGVLGSTARRAVGES